MPGSWVASCAIAGVASAVARIAAAPSSVSFVIAHPPCAYEGRTDETGCLFRGSIHSAVIVRDDGLSPPREKAGGHYAAGLLLQLPAWEVRFRCTSMPKISPPQY